jgi:hypothetical protein
MKHIKGNTTVRSRMICLSGIFLTLFLLSVASSASGQTGSVNFSGTWSLNESKSTPVQGGFRFAATQMVIKQDGNNLTVESTRKGQDGEDIKTTYKYTLDGKVSSNPSFNNNTRVTNVTWAADGKSLNFVHSTKFDNNGEVTEFKYTEIWKLTADNALSDETTMDFQGQENKANNVYDKK